MKSGLTIPLVALSLVACSSSSENAAGVIQVTASGETLALSGFSFPPSDDGPYFVDGWELKIDHLYVTFDNVVISDSPDAAPGDQLKKGNDVAHAKGPWAVDLAKGGPLAGKGSGSQAIAITEISKQDDGDSFVADQKYAFGFDIVAANANAQRINLDGGDDTAYAEMAQKGYTVLYVGTATFKGASCSSSDESFTHLPQQVHFRLGFSRPTTYINCQNPDLGGDDHDSPRGLALKTNEPTVAQMTVHADHPFWDARVEDAPLRFDAFAFVAHEKNKGDSAQNPLTLEDLSGVPFSPIASGGETLLERTCAPAPTPSAAGPMAYDAEGESFADLGAFVRYLQASQGHLNADGLCAVEGIEHSHDHDHDHDDHDHEPGTCGAAGAHCDDDAECCSGECHTDHCH